jgi:glycosyltransferase involved in cell wall biosynthesis
MSTVRKINNKLIKKVEYDVAPNGSRTLKLPPITEDELPCVSVVTITKNRKKLFPIAIYNWEHYYYPKQKLEWVIVDDGEEDLTDILPKDDRIKYIKCKEMDFGDKRNFSVESASYEYICHQDDDDYIFPDSILARVRCMLKYKKEFIYAHNMGIYDTSTKTSAVIDAIRDIGELSLMYTKNFWKSRKFCNIKNKPGFYEAYTLCKKREKEMLGLDFWFVMISITHKGNFTGRLRGVKNTKDVPCFYKLIFPKDFAKILDEVT